MLYDGNEPLGGPSSPQDGGAGTELLYAPSESIFAAAAPVMVGLGWSVFPQEAEGRRPGRVFNATIRWAEEHHLKDKLPTPDALDLWCKHCATLNVACVFGPASGNTFAVDIDVTDEAMSAEIAALADEILGYTPLRREGRAPKIALIYRHAPGEENRVPSGSRFFAEVDADGNATRSEHGLEILGAGKLITFHGRHHKTGNYFKWLDASPMLVGPEAAPLVTEDQVKTFLEAVDARWRFHRGASFAAVGETWQWDDATRMMVPKLALAAGGAAWVEDADGRVVDGREAYLSSLVYRTVTGNLAALEAAQDLGGDKVQKFKHGAAVTVAEQFERTAAMDGRWRQSYVRNEARQKVSHLVDKVIRGDIKVRPASTEPKSGERSFAMPKAPAEEVVGDPEFSFLMPNKASFRKLLKGHVEPPPEGAPSLDIPEDRSEITGAIQERLEQAFRAFFKDVYGHETENSFDLYGAERRSRVHILIAPTGAGKTSRGIRFIAADKRTYESFKWRDPDTGDILGRDRNEGEGEDGANAPIVFLLPTYQNIDELKHRAQVLGLDPDLPDDQLRAQAAALNLIAEDELDEKLAELRRDAIKSGLKTMTYSGKIKAGCMMQEKVEMAMKAGIGTAAFCKATRKLEDGTTEDEFCEHYHECPAIKQRAEIAQVHVVFMPHSFLSLTIPEELRHVRAVVADERIHHLFLHTATFSAMSLSIPRKPPRLTRREREQGVTPDDLLAERDRAARIVLNALREGTCPAEALLDYRNEAAPDDLGLHPGPTYVASALRVCGNAIQRDGNLSPSMPIEEVEELCSQPTGKDVREEWRFWKIIEERIQFVQQDRLKYAAIRNMESVLARFQGDHDLDARLRLERRLAAAKAKPDAACGATDARIQLITENSANGGTTETIRISWRTAPNWLGVPMLLLDASAAPPVIAKIWQIPETDIVVHRVVDDIGRSLNVKIVGVVNQTFSNASLIASPGASEFERINAARNLANVRLALSSVASLYGDGRVVAGTSIVLRQVINNGWVCPDNVDWCHYGAMRGLDMFKFHAAAFSVGRMEVPVRTIDGLVAALTYDDESPEPPFDRMGTGLDPADPRQPLRLPMGEQRLRLRSGHTAVIPVPMFPGKWGRLIQRQYREEELNQFVGRLRPVYREGRTPVWFALSSVIPDDLIVDELVHIDDFLFGRVHLWDACRRTGGVADPEVIAASCPDLFKDVDAVEEAMAQMGFDLDEGAIVGRPARGHAAFRWRPMGGGEVRHAFVRGSVPDPEGRLAMAIREHLKIEPEIKRLTSTEPTLARPRAQDKVERDIGDMTERAAKAFERLADIGKMLLNSEGDVEQIGDMRKYPVGEDAARKMLLPEIEALFAINDHWNNKGGIADDRVMPVIGDGPDRPVEGGEYATYEHLGSTVSDNDTPKEPIG